MLVVPLFVPEQYPGNGSGECGESMDRIEAGGGGLSVYWDLMYVEPEQLPPAGIELGIELATAK